MAYDVNGVNYGGGNASYYSGLSAGGSAVQTAAGDVQAQYAAYNAGEQKRFDDINALYQQNLDALNFSGQQQYQATRDRFKAINSQAQQNLISRGLGGTTMAPGVEGGIAREESSALDALNAGIMQQSLGARTAMAQFQERRTMDHPDMSQLLSLSQQVGMGGGFNGGSGGSVGLDGRPMDTTNKNPSGWTAAYTQAPSGPAVPYGTGFGQDINLGTDASMAKFGSASQSMYQQPRSAGQRAFYAGALKPFNR